MALVTVQRSPTPSAASTASTATTNAGEDFGSDDERRLNQSLSESFFMVKGAALFLQQGSTLQGQKVHSHHKHAGDLPQHLQVMINLLRSEDRIKLAVRLESAWSDRVRYMVVVYTNGRQDTEENILLGMDFTSKERCCTIGMVLPLWSDTKIHLDGDGGFSVNTAGRTHIFKPVSVQAMWSALQILHKACEISRRYNYYQGSVALTWMSYYESCISSEQSCINEWNAMQDLESTRPDSPAMFVDKPTERERTERQIKAKLRSIMMSKDLENVTSKEIRNELEQHMNCNLKEYKEFIDNEMLLILGQMDKATLIFDHVYLGSEWNASNLEELQSSGVGYILNVTREIDNFFPGLFSYHNIRVYDEEATDLLAHWNDTYNFIVKAKKNHSKCLVHCKMGVSRSASTVIAYAMKEYGWSLEVAYNYVKQKRSITRPNAGFMRQLAEYEGILDASKQRHNKLWRPDSDSEMTDGQQASLQLDEAGENPSEFTIRPPDELWDVDGARPSPSRTIGVEVDPADPPNYNYYFRRLSDSALDSEPSTPVRAPPLLDMDRVYIAIEDVERDALLDDEPFEGRECSLHHFAVASEGTAAQTCRLEPLEAEIRRKLDFGTVEEEDEEEAEAEVALLMEPQREGGNIGEGEESSAHVKEDIQALRCSSIEEQNRLNNKNSNNNNSLSSKRSFQEGSDDSANIRSIHKVKPLYWVCTECMPSPSHLCCESMKTNHSQSLNPVQQSGNCTLGNPVMRPLSGVVKKSLGNCAICGITASESFLKTCHQKVDPVSCDGFIENVQARWESSFLTKIGELNEKKNIKDLKLLKISLEEEKPMVASYLMQHQESIIQLQKAGLVKKHAKELEKLTNIAVENSKASAQLRDGEHMDFTSEHESLLTGSQKDVQADFVSKVCETNQQQTSTPHSGQPSTPLCLTRDLLKTVGGQTPTSSPYGSTLTRSSSSDSIHSIRGKPGLVKQRAQEIEARLRLAGLTVSSRLKRSNSLAKLAILNFSSDDLSSIGSSAESNVTFLSRSASSKDSRSWQLSSVQRETKKTFMSSFLKSPLEVSTFSPGS
ncbi:protein phosphatase Slingshot homolog 1 isoform X1 [Polypterus senegalus]|uniref:protein phosphatase Slingshot homolog 1 isoform X1 n=1 Tax=Polypterus senegalus TaxID=55291 RepID=UPI00196516BE|nr:protein phosphatase Slingshot homolog 1 isoform X1 [Polypterus senegalus]